MRVIAGTEARTVTTPAAVMPGLAGAEGGEAIVCMPAGGRAGVPGSDARQQLPWAV